MTITVILHVIILILLFFFGLTYLDPPPEKGIAVNFGTTDYGKGDIQPSEPVKTAPKQTSPEPIPETKNDPDSYREKEEVVTQDNEEAPVIKKEDKKEEVVETPKEEPRKVIPKKVEPKPDKSTTDALSSLINGPKNNGTAEGSEGDDDKAGDKGDPKGDLNAKSYYGNGIGLDGDGNYRLGGRKALNKAKEIQKCNEAGRVVVSIEVDRSGKVISARPGVRGTTNNTKCLLDPAKKAALATRFNSDADAPAKQIGKIIYNFTLSN